MLVTVSRVSRLRGVNLARVTRLRDAIRAWCWKDHAQDCGRFELKDDKSDPDPRHGAAEVISYTDSMEILCTRA